MCVMVFVTVDSIYMTQIMELFQIVRKKAAKNW
jgi:hypothetical protein